MDFGLRLTVSPSLACLANACPRRAQSGRLKGKSAAAADGGASRYFVYSYSCDEPHRPIPVRRAAAVFREVRQGGRPPFDSELRRCDQGRTNTPAPDAIMQGITTLPRLWRTLMNTARLLPGLAAAATCVLAACGTDPTAPSGVCASAEQEAALLYGPPLSVTTSGDTTTYTWGGGKVLFIAEGSNCVEQQGQQHAAVDGLVRRKE